MSRSPGADLADHVRWLDSDAHSLTYVLQEEGSISIQRMENFIKMAKNTLKCLRRQRMWECM